MSEGGVVLGFDPGRRKTGISVGNLVTKTAEPLVTLRGNFDSQCDAAEQLCHKWKPHTLIIGISDPQRAKAAHRYSRVFAAELSRRYKARIVFVDEEYSSQAAHADRDSKHSVDAIAASIITNDWLSKVGT